MIRTFASALAATTCIVAFATPAAAQNREFNVPAGPLRAALDTFARQSGRQVIYSSDVRSARSPGVRGALTAEAALEAILAGTGFVVKQDRTGALAIVKAGNGAVADEVTSPREDAGSSSNSEIVVTGTLIRGAETTSRVSTYSRDEITKQGFSTLRDFVQRLPENFAGGANEYTSGINAGGSGDANNTVNATSINLRGLGNEATLILLNGQRVAPAAQKGNFVDISMIPLSAIAQVDVLPDGASATYGSDAVGGVVNISLRRDFEGAETGLRFGTTTRGGRDEIRANQAFGKSWASGGILAVYEFSRETELKAEDRSFARNDVSPPFWLLPRTRSHNILVAGHQALGEKTEFHATALYANKIGEKRVSYPGVSGSGKDSVKQIMLSAGATSTISDSLTLDVDANFSKSHTRGTAFDLLAQLPSADNIYETQALSLDGKLSGDLLELPAGPLTFAIGGHYRNERFSNFFDPDPSLRTFKVRRNVAAAFAEVHVPLIINQEGDERALLEIVAADRYERYSDFGSTNNMKLGAIARPGSGITLKASYGTSFVAPLLADLNPIPSQVAPLPGIFFDLFGGAVNAPNTLLLFGGNPDLRPQTSKDFSTGLEYDQPGPDGLRLYVNYYNIKYRNKIGSLGGLLPNFLEIYAKEADFGAGVLRRNPSAAEVAYFTSFPTFENFSNVDLSTIGAIADSRQRNLSSVHTSGADFGISYAFAGDWGRNELGFNGTYIFEYKTSTSPTSTFSQLNTAYNPIDLKFRVYNTLQLGKISTSLFWNYIDSYYANSDRAARVPSWSTFDVNVAYETDDGKGPFSGLRLSLGVYNLTDEAPHRIPGALNVLFYDGANANPLGRAVYFDVRKRF